LRRTAIDLGNIEQVSGEQQDLRDSFSSSLNFSKTLFGLLCIAQY
jgi:hypothetical protein